MLLKRYFQFCSTSFCRMNQILYQKAEATEPEKQYLFDIFKHTNMSNRDHTLQERSLALQLKILPRLDKEMIKFAKEQIENLVTDKARNIREIQTILKIFQIHNQNLIDLDSQTIDKLLFNARIRVENKIEHGFGNDGFLQNTFTENVFILGKTDEDSIAFLEQIYKDQIDRISLYNLLRFFQLIQKYQVKGMQATELLVLETMYKRIKFATLFDCANAARLYNQMHDAPLNLKQWINEALTIVDGKISKPNSRLTLLNSYGRDALVKFMEVAEDQKLITKLLALSTSE